MAQKKQVKATPVETVPSIEVKKTKSKKTDTPKIVEEETIKVETPKKQTKGKKSEIVVAPQVAEVIPSEPSTKKSTTTKKSKKSEPETKKDEVTPAVETVIPTSSKKTKKEVALPVVDAAAPASGKKSKKNLNEAQTAFMDAVVNTVVNNVITTVINDAINAKKTAESVKEKPVKKSARKSKATKEVESNEEVAAVEEVVEPKEGTDEKVKVPPRYFKLVVTKAADGNEITIDNTEDSKEEKKGRFKGRKPKQAGSKAFTAIQKSMKSSYNLGDVIYYKIEECTRGSKRKQYSYSGYRAALSEPCLVVSKLGKFEPITYNFKNYIKKHKEPLQATEDEVIQPSVSATN